MTENTVTIKGNKYKYTYDPDTQGTNYLGPVGSSPPLTEEEFLGHIRVSDWNKMAPVVEDVWDEMVIRSFLNRLEKSSIEPSGFDPHLGWKSIDIGTHGQLKVIALGEARRAGVQDLKNAEDIFFQLTEQRFRKVSGGDDLRIMIMNNVVVLKKPVPV